ncbi:nuclear valosin-containing protein-like isoform X2 [Ochlerotatus camptorhynchus]|uniref:nuclear valosin-containing protein-like isoform X2 n=1 Tax=Ochlerotatus camptorhynchus TaxID=644619 RepID=UPI0031E46A90
MLQKKPAGGLYDPMIIPRVKQYLEENVHQTYVDVGVMARELQERYREYNRRKAVPFRLLVEQAYKTVLHSYGLDSNPSSENEDDGNSDLEVMEDGAGGGGSGGGAAAASGSAGANDGEAIDISSDEEEGGADSRDKDKAVSTTSNSMRLIETQIASNKHITVTKVTRADKPRSGDEAVDSSNGSSNGPRRPAEQLPASQPKRRRLDQPQNSEVSNSSNPLLPYPTPMAPARTAPQSNRGGGMARSESSAPTAAPRSKRFKKEVCARFVDSSFEDVGGMDKILRELCELLLHVKHPEVYRHVGLPPPRGFLLHGPPGSGKTLLAHAIAGQLKIGLVEVPATELVAGVSGESEERIREVFEQAAVLSPCVLFIDEIDAISSNRVNAQKDMERRIVAQLLSSLDNLPKLEGGDGVLVIGATNRADALDPALRRVGRFDQEISLGIPDRQARAQILKIICRNLKIEQSIDFDELAKLTPGYVGADLLALATRAATTAIKRMLTEHERQQLIEKSRLDIELEAARRKRGQEQLHKKADDDDDVMEVNEASQAAEITKNKFNGDVSADDVVAVEDDVEEVVNLDDDKDEPKEAEQTEAVVTEKVAEVRAEEEKKDEEKKDEEKKDEEKKDEEKKDEEKTDAEKIAEEKTGEEKKDEEKKDEESKVDEGKVDSAEAKPAEEGKKDDGETKEVDASEKKVDEEPKPEEAKTANEDVEMAADSSTSGDKVEPEEPKSTTAVVESMPAESSEAEKKADEPMETETVQEAEAPVEKPQQEEKETVVESLAPAVEKRAPTPVLTLDKMIHLLLDHSNPLPDEELESLCIQRSDFLESLKTVQPSAKREGFITVPDVTWDDIGSLGDIREELKLAILAPVKFPQRLKMLGLTSPSGVLLCGPPGCGKTLLAKAVANEAGINFISVKGPELLNMYVGESERAVRQCFQRARNSAPCVIFFDEFDSLCPKRSDNSEGGAGMRVVNQLLTEMDGIEERKGVFLMAATNRPDIVDPAVLRPGRLDKILYVGLPAEDDRADILRALTKNRTQPPLADDVDLAVVARLSQGYTGADLAGLVRQASLQTLKDSIAECSSDDKASTESEQDLKVAMVHFQEAIRTIKPSVNEEDTKHYERLKRKYGSETVAQ